MVKTDIELRISRKAVWTWPHTNYHCIVTPESSVAEIKRGRAYYDPFHARLSVLDAFKLRWWTVDTCYHQEMSPSAKRRRSNSNNVREIRWDRKSANLTHTTGALQLRHSCLESHTRQAPTRGWPGHSANITTHWVCTWNKHMSVLPGIHEQSWYQNPTRARRSVARRRRNMAMHSGQLKKKTNSFHLNETFTPAHKTHFQPLFKKYIVKYDIQWKYYPLYKQLLSIGTN